MANLNLHANEIIRVALEEHQQKESDWSLQDLMIDITRTRDILISDFKIATPSPIVSLKRLRRDSRFTFDANHNDLGLAGTLTLNATFLEACIQQKAEFAIIALLLHGLLLAEQHAIGNPTGRISEPTPALKQRAKEFGLLLSRGSSFSIQGPPSPLSTLIENAGYTTPESGGFELEMPNETKSTNRLWICPCGNKLRVGKGMALLICGNCWNLFEPSGAKRAEWLRPCYQEIEELLSRIREELNDGLGEQ